MSVHPGTNSEDPAVTDLQQQIDQLSEPEREQVLRDLLDRLLEATGDLVADSEESARECIAALLSQSEPTEPNQVISPVIEVSTHVDAALRLLASDPQTQPLVQATLRNVRTETQMFADPVSAAIVLGVLVAFLQTKLKVSLHRKDGKVDFNFNLAKDAASDETIGKVVAAVRAAALK